MRGPFKKAYHGISSFDIDLVDEDCVLIVDSWKER